MCRCAPGKPIQSQGVYLDPLEDHILCQDVYDATDIADSDLVCVGLGPTAFFWEETQQLKMATNGQGRNILRSRASGPD